MAKLYFRYGAMNCGKTASLLQAIHNYEDRELEILLLKPVIDSKGEDKVVSRTGLERKVDHLLLPNENLYRYLTLHDEGISCIFVDEAQFLKRKQVNDLMRIVIKDDIPAICYGLRTDFLGNGFAGSTRILEIAHTIEEMKTICRCGKIATMNGRRVNGVFVFDGNQVAIDGEGKVTYDSLCPECFEEEKRKYEKAKIYQKTRKSSNNR